MKYLVYIQYLKRKSPIKTTFWVFVFCFSPIEGQEEGGSPLRGLWLRPSPRSFYMFYVVLYRWTCFLMIMCVINTRLFITTLKTQHTIAKIPLEQENYRKPLSHLAKISVSNPCIKWPLLFLKQLSDLNM